MPQERHARVLRVLLGDLGTGPGGRPKGQLKRLNAVLCLVSVCSGCAWVNIEQVIRRLEAYVKQGMSQPDALARLRESLQRKSGPANDGPLAILAKDD